MSILDRFSRLSKERVHFLDGLVREVKAKYPMEINDANYKTSYSDTVGIAKRQWSEIKQYLKSRGVKKSETDLVFFTLIIHYDWPPLKLIDT